MNKDEAAGKLEQAKGTAKRKLGSWTGEPDLEAKGRADEVKGKARETAGTIRRKAEDAIDETKKKSLDR
jgi:uncharacterized protein YjbJ (UPF0337 family)